MNPQQQTEDNPSSPDQNSQPYEQPQGPAIVQTPTPVDSSTTAQDYAMTPAATEQPLPPAEASYVTTQANKANKLKKILIAAAVLIVLVVLVPVVISIFSAPKLQQGASDTAQKNDLAIIASELNKYKSTAGTFPNATQFYDGTFRPEGVTHITASDAVNYVPTPDSCNAQEVKCDGFTLNMKLDSGKDYSLSN